MPPPVLVPDDLGEVLSLEEAPPIRAPSISGWAMSRPLMFSGFMLPPYWMRTLIAVPWPKVRQRGADRRANRFIGRLGVAVRPVPMAQTGS